LNKHRSKRGSNASRIREAMFVVFGSDQLPLINTHATSVEITNWKKSDKVRACYNKLPSYMERILQRACGSEKQRSPAQVVFAKTLVKAMLNPKINQIRISEDFMKNKIEKYSVQNSNCFFFKKNT
jgi:hypothetical protein